MPKILFLTNSIGMGGASVAIINILPHLINHGIVPYVLYPEEGEFSTTLNLMGIKNTPINNPLEIYPTVNNTKDIIKFPFRLAILLYKRHNSYKKLCQCIEDFHPDLIHTNVGPIHIGFKAAKKYKIPHVWHIREYQIEDFRMYPFPSLKSFRNHIHDCSNHNISITKEIFTHFDLDHAKDAVIYDGVINKEECPPINENKGNYILFAGRLEDAKGIKSLIKAYIKYRDKGHLDLYIAGTGEKKYIQECKDLIPNKYKSNIHFLGLRKDVFKLMYNAQIFVTPSRKEGFGFITAEAMFNGTTVIGRNIGGTKEQFDNGFTLTGKEIGYRYKDEEELIRLLLENESKQNKEILQNAQNVVCKLYDIEIQTSKILELYNNITTVP